MTEPKLRTFKLIDREGFMKYSHWNPSILKKYFSNTEVVEIFEVIGEDYQTLGGDCIFTKNELRFFEEVTEDQENWSGDGLPPVGTICKAYHDNSGEYYDVEILKTCNDGVPEVAVCMKVNDFRVFWSSDFRPISKKTWQEKVSEEFDIDYTTSGDFKFEHTMGEERLIEMAKRIIELSEGEK